MWSVGSSLYLGPSICPYFCPYLRLGACISGFARVIFCSFAPHFRITKTWKSFRNPIAKQRGVLTSTFSTFWARKSRTNWRRRMGGSKRPNCYSQAQIPEVGIQVPTSALWKSEVEPRLPTSDFRKLRPTFRLPDVEIKLPTSGSWKFELGGGLRPVLRVSYDAKPPPQGEGIRAVVHASYEIEPPSRGEKSHATVLSSSGTKPPRQGDKIRATRRAHCTTEPFHRVGNI